MSTYPYLIEGSTLDDAISRLIQDSELQASELTKKEAKVSLAYFKGDELATTVFLKKYALRDDKNNFLELTLPESQDRCIKAVTEIDPTFSRESQERLHRYFLAAGRQLLALGNPFLSKASYSNCYDTAIEEDSLEGIFNTAYKIARTYSFGGGQGICLGTLRPHNALVSNTARTSTGSVSFGALFSYITGAIGQYGRRGALLLSLPVYHPDIEEFIQVKHHNRDSLRYANISVKITNEFMEAVKEGKQFRLHFETSKEKIERTVDARTLWQQIIQAARDSAEPGLLFWDHIVDESPSDNYVELKLVCTNPCSELPLSPDEACVLGSLLMHKFVSNPFTPTAEFEFDLFKRVIRLAVRYLDDIVELNLTRHPLPSQSEKAKLGRRIGLSLTGLADMMVALNQKYYNPDLLEEIFRVKCETEYMASIDLAKERGAFPLFDARVHYSRGVPSRLPAEIIEAGKKWGQRNLTISTVAPSGSISIIGQCSNGIEPIFATSFTRVVELGKKRVEFRGLHPGLIRLKETNPEANIEQVETAYTVDPEQRLEMQRIAQQYVDSAISSTINLPEDTTTETIANIYMSAWEKKLKGVTVYRANSREGIFISEDGKPSHKSEKLDTATHKFTAEGGDTFYVHVSYRDGDISKPYQVFVTNYKAADNDRFVKIGNSLHRMLVGQVPDQKLGQQLERSNSALSKLTRLLSLSLKHDLLIQALPILQEHAYVGTLSFHLHKILQNSAGKSKCCCPHCGGENLRSENGACATCLDCGTSLCGS